MKSNASNSLRRIVTAGVCSTLVSMAVPLCAQASGDLMFATPFLSCDVGCPPGWLAVGDLNGDGKQDLAVATLEGAEVISVLIGNGDWTFASPVSYYIGSYPGPVAIADLNGDGALDLVAMAGFNTGDNHLSVLLGDGSGTFGPRSDYATGRNWSNSLAIGDVNGDGKPDLVVTNELPPLGTVSVLIGNGDGTFAPKTDYVTEPRPRAVAIGDLNGDGVADLAVMTSGSVSVLPGIGGGAFGAAIWSAPSVGPLDVRIDDLNGDGDLDLVVASDSQVSVFLGDGSGVFGMPTEYDCPGGSLLLADLNGDRRLDVATAGPHLSVMLGAGDGTLGECIAYDAGTSPATPALADLDGDGKRDMVVANRRYNPNDPSSFCPVGTISMLSGNGDGTFGTPFPTLIEPGHGLVALRDLNGDGRLDLLTRSSAATVSVSLGNGHGGFGARTDFPVSGGAVAIEDLNHDGALDLAVTHRSSNTVSVLLGGGDGTFGPSRDFATGTSPVGVAIADFNLDGAPDLVTANDYGYQPHWLSLLLGAGDGTFASPIDFPVFIASGSDHFNSVTAVEVNADGIPDLVVTLFGTYDYLSSGALAVLRGRGDGTFALPNSYGASNPTSVAIGDLNLDGRPDLAVTNAGPVNDYHWEGPGSVVALLGNVDGTFTSSGGGTVDEWPSCVVIDDLDGDDRPDLVVSSGSRVTVLRGRGDGTVASRQDYGAPGGVGRVATGDLDGDSRPDLALSTAGGVMLLLNVMPGWPTPTLLSMFHGVWSAQGIELRWQFGDPAAFASVAVERGESAEGPWRAVEGERREEGGTSVLLDSTAEPGRRYFYRLLAARTGGEPMIFGPLEVTAGAAAEEFALLLVAPNPGHDRVRIGFAVARPAHVRLGVLDVQGRHVARLVDEVRTSGRYEVAWDGRTEGGLAPAGVYFVRYEAAGVRRVQRFALTR